MLNNTIFARFAGLGDAVFMNTIVFHFWKETGKKVLVASNQPQIFAGNPGAWTFPFSSIKWLIRSGILMQKVRLVDGFTFLTYQPEGQGETMQPMKEHILSFLAHKVGLREIVNKPLLFLSKKELRKARLPEGTRPWLAMHSTGITEMTENKNWYPDRFVRVAENLKSHFRVVQLGLPSDPVIPCDLDLRGKVSPRGAAATIASCAALICQVGYLMHAAAAVGTPAIVIYGGFEAPWESGYAWNVNLFTKLPCSPCWLKGPCPYNKKCMQEIRVEEVTEKALEILLNRQPSLV